MEKNVALGESKWARASDPEHVRKGKWRMIRHEEKIEKSTEDEDWERGMSLGQVPSMKSDPVSTPPPRQVRFMVGFKKEQSLVETHEQTLSVGS